LSFALVRFNLVHQTGEYQEVRRGRRLGRCGHDQAGRVPAKPKDPQSLEELHAQIPVTFPPCYNGNLKFIR